ncbi:hypothetical protein [Nostoc sp. PCC 7107]|uniref:hypothetical protein n=1 Tax=Nostoc sp. PCC 7107 TaxID=317936 RepID=UPI0012F86D59|nr:hypothetical protein [Nostoc sp. PCC 7107]
MRGSSPTLYSPLPNATGNNGVYLPSGSQFLLLAKTLRVACFPVGVQVGKATQRTAHRNAVALPCFSAHSTSE